MLRRCSHLSSTGKPAFDLLAILCPVDGCMLVCTRRDLLFSPTEASNCVYNLGACNKSCPYHPDSWWAFGGSGY
ncbi:hypothetical protein BDW75DRAFT_204484 [Aspergillus navahoensis]